jgi:phage terminase small subunit
MLTQKQETFCIEYVKTGNATNAAITAGYAPKNADITASKNLRNASVSARIAELRKPLRKSLDDRIARLEELAFENIYSDKGVPIRHSNIQAIQELNKMDGVYETNTVINQDNRSITFVVRSDESIALVEKAKARLNGTDNQ